jgi:hypothetical protein
MYVRIAAVVVLIVWVAGLTARAEAQASGTVEVAASSAGYVQVDGQVQGTVVVAAPPPPPGYVVQAPVVVQPQPAYYVQPGPPPPRDTSLGLRILAEIAGYFVGAIATAGLVFATLPAATSGDEWLFVASALVGVLVLCPLGTWLGGNLAGGNGGLGWTLIGNMLFGIFGAVAAYELSHDPSLGRGQQPGAHFITQRNVFPGATVPLGAVSLTF